MPGGQFCRIVSAMSVPGVIFGLAMMVVGFFAVWKTDTFVKNFGDVGAMFGNPENPYASWKIVGVVLMIAGFIIGTGLLTLFLQVLLGSLFGFGRS